MPQVRVPKESFIKGNLPNVCAISGAIAKENYIWPATSPNGRIMGAIPLTASTVVSIGKARRLTLVLFFLSVFVMSIGVVGRSFIYGWVAMALLAAAGGCLLMTFKRNVRAKVDGDDVILDHVHEHFRKAIQSPNSKCSDCNGNGKCSVAEMEDCENE